MSTSSYSSEEERGGKFQVHLSWMSTGRWKKLIPIFIGCIPVRCELLYTSQCMSYEVLGDKFPLIPDGGETLEYLIAVKLSPMLEIEEFKIIPKPTERPWDCDPPEGYRFINRRY